MVVVAALSAAVLALKKQRAQIEAYSRARESRQQVAQTFVPLCQAMEQVAQAVWVFVCVRALMMVAVAVVELAESALRMQGRAALLVNGLLATHRRICSLVCAAVHLDQESALGSALG